MNLAIMQPYFFPYPGYFDLINKSDKWIVFDTPQYIRHGWVNRNRILHPDHGWQYFLVPLKKHNRETGINHIEIAEQTDWRSRILAQLVHYKKKAPFYRETVRFVESCLDSSTSYLAQLNIQILKKTCDYLELDFDFNVFSGMDLKLGKIDGPGDWALRISEKVGAKRYINPPGGRVIFSEEKFVECGIALEIQEYDELIYATKGYQFEPGLSIIDALMWQTPAQIKRHLDVCKQKWMGVLARKEEELVS